MARAIAQARRVAASDIPLLLLGETGTGKEVLARAIHAAGPRARKAFVAVNCAGLPETLIEAELFGYAAGAFTGARRDGAPGRILEADGGTLFLDEIGDMPPAMQARLLRVLEDRFVVPLGGKPRRVDIALMAATHRDLARDIAAGRFRADLFYRLAGLSLTLPPLRERTDFEPLLHSLLANACGDRQPPQLAPSLLAAMRLYSWPGNLRQLATMLKTAVLLREEEDSMLELRHLPDDVAAALHTALDTPLGTRPAVPTAALRTQTDAAIRAALDAAGGNVTAAARALGIGRNTLYRRLAAQVPEHHPC
jgi:transcriptional regulator with PAS, ATPase and Fis domain